MIGRYIAFVTPRDATFSRAAFNVEAALREAGMQACFAADPITLFVSKQTPTLPIPGNGILVGHLFTRNGTLLRDGSKLPELPDSAQIRRHILENYWGTYVLFQPDASDVGGITVTRDPSSSANFPCIHSISEGSGFITSDISLAVGLRLYRRSVDWDFVIRRLTCSAVKTQQTGLTDVSELLPGCSLHCLGTEVSKRQEWSPWDFVRPERRHSDPNQAAAEVRSAVMGAVRAWAEIDDSVLLELSGGLDSSIVAACLQKTSTRVVCFNLSTPVPGADERSYAGLMAEELGVELHTEELGFDKARFDFTPPPDSVVPAMGPLQYAINSTMERVGERHGISSFLSGGGGDTVFCYLRTAAPAADAFRENGLAAAAAAIRDLAGLHQCTLWKAGRLTLSKLLRTPKSHYEMDASFIAPGMTSGAPEEHPWFAAPINAMPGDRERISDLAGNQLFPNQAPRGAIGGLRLPLLSQPVMESCLKVPTWMWISGGRNRAVARTAFSAMLPADVLHRQSKGTFVNYLGAVYRKDKDRISEFLLTGQLKANGLLDAEALKGFLGSDLPLRNRSFLRIFDLCMVENWVRHQH